MLLTLSVAGLNLTGTGIQEYDWTVSLIGFDLPLSPILYFYVTPVDDESGKGETAFSGYFNISTEKPILQRPGKHNRHWRFHV